MSTNFVVINSAYRTSDSRSTSDFTYNIGTSIETDFVTIKSVSIPHVEYNITISKNKLRISSGGTTHDLTVPVGQYDVSQLITELQAQIIAAIGGTCAITLDPVTKKLNFQASAGLRISTDKTLSSISKYLGIPYNSGFYPITDSTNFDATALPVLQGSNNYYLASSVLSQGYASILTNGQRVPIIMPVPIDVEYGRIQQYESNDTELNTKQFSRPQNIQNIDIKIYDDDLNIVDLQGQDIEVVLKI
jgi:hypothetical protein